MIGAILSVAVACGIFVYTEWENKRFTDSLLKLPSVEQQTVDVHPHSHPHPHEHPVSATDSNTGAFESEMITIENSVSTEPTAKDDDQSVDESHILTVEQTGETWQTDGAHEHKFTRSPFARKLLKPEDMDPDELADMLLKGLIQRFGDIPEVHTFMEIKRKMYKKEPINWDERIAYTKAQYHLWPHPETKKTLEIYLGRREAQYPRSTHIVR